MKIVLLNGPPRAGKDTAADEVTHSCGFRKVGFSHQLKDATHASYGMYGIPHFAFEEVKDGPRAEFFGLTPRAAYIKHSEEYMKPAHGQDVFGHLFLRRLRDMRINDKRIVVPDSGFQPEAQVLINEIGAHNILLIRVHRPHRDFRNDSRSYIDLPGVESYDIRNDISGSTAAFRAAVTGTVRRWLDQTK